MIRACFLISGAAASCHVSKYETVSELKVCRETVSQRIHRRDDSPFHLPVEDCRLELNLNIEKGVESVRALSVQTDVGEDGKRWRTVKCAARPRTDSAFTESLRNIIPLAMKGLLDIPEDEPLVSLGSYSVLIGGATYLEFDSRDQQKNACKYLLGHRDKIIEHLTVARTVVKTRESRVQHDMRRAGVGARAGPTGSRRGEASDEFSYRNPMRYGLN